MHTCVRLDSLPESIRAEALRQGRASGVRVEIAAATLARLLEPFPDTALLPAARLIHFPGVSLRSELDQAALLTICDTCEFNRGGRCSKCRHCGGGIPVQDWVKLSTHHCPQKKW